MSTYTNKQIRRRSPQRTARVLTALAQYANGSILIHEIAKRAGTSPAAISLWARKAGLARRMRGRRPLKEPSPKHERILKLLGVGLNSPEVGAVVGMSRQGVAQVAKRWGRGCRSSGDLPLKSVESHLVGKPYRRIDQRETKAIVVSFRLPVSAFEKLAVSAANCPWRRSPQGLARAMVLHYLTSNEEL